MSRIGKLLIEIPAAVHTNYANKQLSVKGPKGELKLAIHPLIDIVIEDKIIKVTRQNDEKAARALHGLHRALINNMVIGVTIGFEKKLEIQGVGFKAQLQGKKLILNLGFSHPVEYHIPLNIEIKQDQEKKNILTVSGIDKQLVGAVSAKIRSYKKPEPYKGKGIRYSNEHIVKKAGKTAGAKEK